jgi:hypothetical protein
MAKSNNFETLDEFGLDNSLDVPDFDFGGQAQKEITRSKGKVARDLGMATFKGAIGGVTDGSYILRTIRSNLPKGYGTAFDVADEATSTLRSLYNDSYKEIKPLVADMKRTVQRLEQPLDKYLPKSLSSRLNAWAKNIDGASVGPSAEEQREAVLNASLAEVFKHQVTSEARREQKDDARSQIREQIDQMRHKNSMGQLNAIRVAVSQMNAYQNNIGVNFQRKSLEVQYRSYFALRDMLEEQRKQGAVQLEAYAKLVTNTGKPDYEKLTEKDRLKQVFRNRFLGEFENGIFGGRSDFIRKVGSNLRDVVMDRVRNFTQGAAMGLQGAEMVGDMLSMTQGMEGLMPGMSPEEMIAGQVGNATAQHYGSKAVKWGLKKLPTQGRMGDALNKLRGHVGRIGNQVSYYGRNIPQQAQAWAKNYQGLPYVPDFISEILREAVLRDSGIDRTLQKDRLKDMQGPAVFSRQVAKSITEVIPGYLARIWREIQVLRTGDETTPMSNYDYMKNKFDTVEGTRKRAYDSLISKTHSEWLHRDLDSLMDHLDPEGPEGRKLSKDDREALRKKLLMDNLRGFSGSAEYYQNTMNYGEVTPEQSAKFSELFQNKYGGKNDQSFAQRDEFSRLHNQIGTNIKLSRASIQDMANAGMLDILESLGIVDEHGMISPEKIFEYHLNPEYVAAAAATASPGGKSLKQGRRLGRGRTSTGGGTTYNSSFTHNHMHGAPTAAQPEQRAHTQANADSFKEVVEAIKANSSLSATEKVNATLVRIEEHISRGLVMYNAGNLEAKELNADGSPFLDKSLRQHWRSAKTGVGGAAQRAWDWWKEPGWFADKWGKRGQYMDATRKKLGEWGTAAKDKWTEMNEVWIDGELKPRLTALGLKAGMYYDGPITDAHRKVIKSFKDIKGAVYDIDGKPIMDAAEAARVFARNKVFTKAVQAKDWLKGKAQEGIALARSAGGGIYNTAWEMGKKAQGYVDAQDVFTKSNLETPKLQAVIMRAKGYRSMHRRDKYIMTPADIDGPVVDLSGNQVLTDDHIREGLCDKFGRPLVTGKLRLLQIGKDTIARTIQAVQNGFNKAKEFLSGKWQGFANWFKIDGIAFSGGKTIIERLTQIRDMLDQRLPKRKKHVIGDVDGDGLREGSFEDMKKKGELHNDKGESHDAHGNLGDTLDGIKSGGKSLYGAIGAGLKGLLDRFNKRKKGKGGEEEGEGGGSTMDEVANAADIASDVFSFLPGGKFLRGSKKWLGKGFKMFSNGAKGGADWMKMRRAAKLGSGFVSAGEAAAAAEGMASEAGGIGAEAQAVAQAAKEVGGSSKLMSLLGALKTGFGGLRKGAGAVLEANRGLNKSTWDVAKGVVGTGLKYGAKGVAGGLAAGGYGLYQGAKWGIPALAKSTTSGLLGLGKGALGMGSKFLKMGSGLGAGIALDVGSHYAEKTGHWKVANALDKASTGMAIYGGLGTIASIAGVEGGALGLLALVGGTIGAVPLAIAAGVAAAGYGAYKLYKWAKSKSLTPLSTLRYIQYGFKPDDHDHYSAVFKLEDMLEKNVVMRNGIAMIDSKGLKEEDLLDIFDIDKHEKEKIQKWAEWFTLRFKPVFLVHMTALNKVDPNQKTLAKVESLKPADKKKFFDIAKWPNGPYKYMTSPFSDLESLTQGPVEVEDYVKSIQPKIDEDAKKNPGDTKAAQTAKENAVPKTVAQITSAATVAQALHHGADKSAWTSITKMPDGSKDGAGGTGVAVGGAMVTMKGTFDATQMSAGATLDGISCVRYKTYGLRDMNIEKVRSLIGLEARVSQEIDFGSDGKAVWKGDLKKTFADIAPSFGAQTIQSKAGYSWLSWFQNRFMPTYLNYATAIYAATKKTDLKAAMLTLKGDDAVTVATAVKNSTGPQGSVWKVTDMPWLNYDANTDATTTDSNIAGLQDLATRTSLKETQGSTTSGDKSKDKAGSDSKSGVGNWLSKKWDSLTHNDDGSLNTFGKVTNAVGNAASKVYNTATSALGLPNGSPSGQAISDGGSGTGGAAAQLPNPNGDGSWAALKDLITGAAKMVGVDPGLLGTMAAVESGFKTNAKAGTSSASGLFQFITGTWNDLVRKAGGKYGVTAGASRTDPKANAVMGAVYTKQNIDTLKQGLGRMPTAGEVYGAHFLGAGTALKLFKGNPSAIAASLLPEQASANHNIFYNGSTPRTVGEVIQVFNNLMANRSKQYGIQLSGGEALTTSDSGQKSATSGATGAGGAAAPSGNTGNNGLFAGAVGGGAKAPSTPPSTGTGAPSGFGGSGGGGAVNTPKAAIDAMGGAPSSSGGGKTADWNQSPLTQKPDHFAVPNQGPSAAMGTGFSPNAGMAVSDLQSSRRAQQAATPGVPDVQTQSLQVQKDMLTALQTLVKLAQTTGNGAQAQPTAETGNSPTAMQSTISSVKAASQAPTKMQPSLVSVAKPQFTT